MTRATTQARHAILSEIRSYVGRHLSSGQLERLTDNILEALSAPPMGEAFAYAYRYRDDPTWQLTMSQQQATDKTHDVQPLYALAQPGSDGALREALGKAVVFNAYSAADPLAIRLEFETERDRLDAANAIDAATTPAIREGGENG